MLICNASLFPQIPTQPTSCPIYSLKESTSLIYFSYFDNLYCRCQTAPSTAASSRGSQKTRTEGAGLNSLNTNVNILLCCKSSLLAELSEGVDRLRSGAEGGRLGVLMEATAAEFVAAKDGGKCLAKRRMYTVGSLGRREFAFAFNKGENSNVHAVQHLIPKNVPMRKNCVLFL